VNLNLSQVVAVVLAGGHGTRVRHLLAGVPKPMAQVAGRPFLEWVLRYLAKQGLRKAVLSTGYLADVIENHFASQPVPGITTRCSREGEPLGTGGGFLNAVRASGESPEAWLLLNGDSLFLAGLAAAVERLGDPQTAGVLLGRVMPDASRYGTLAVGPENQLLGFEEKRPGHGLVNTGVYLLKDSLVREFPSRLPLSLEKEVFPQWIKRHFLLKVHESNAPFLDIGTPESLQEAEGFVKQHVKHFS
jgi:D-glycero-alpha-D-manno-heptose 1-phosphate guanylyltransferase